MEVAVSDMADDGAVHATVLNVGLGVLDKLRQPTHGNGDVSSPNFVAGLGHGEGAPERLLAGTPEVVLLLLGAGELEALAAGGASHILNDLDLFLDAEFGAGEFEEQGGCLVPMLARHASMVNALHLLVVEDLYRCDGYALADDTGNAVGSLPDGAEATYGNAGAGGFDGKLQRGFGDETKCTFTTDKQLSQVVASRALARTLPRLNYSTVGQHDGKRKHPFSHSTVSVGIGAAATSTDHASDHSAGTGIRREKEVILGQFLIEELPADGGLHHNIKILLV